MRNAKASHTPLHPLDSEKQTVGFRHANSDNCAKNAIPKVCALVRTDKTCHAPPRSWAKKFKKHKEGRILTGQMKPPLKKQDPRSLLLQPGASYFTSSFPDNLNIVQIGPLSTATPKSLSP
jgi:hypothetical protein